VPRAVPAAPARRFYYTLAGQQQGPAPAEQVRELLRSGKVKPNDWVVPEGGKDWVPAASVPELP
jgi:hypothetical protein